MTSIDLYQEATNVLALHAVKMYQIVKYDWQQAESILYILNKEMSAVIFDYDTYQEAQVDTF